MIIFHFAYDYIILPCGGVYILQGKGNEPKKEWKCAYYFHKCNPNAH